MQLECPFCDTDVDLTSQPFYLLGKVITCPACKKRLEVGYDSFWEEGMEDSVGGFHLAAAPDTISS